MSLADARAELVTLCRDAGFTHVFDHPPAKIAPPCVTIASADPWLTPGDVYGTWTVSYVLSLFLAVDATNEVAAKLAEAQVKKLLEAIADPDSTWGMTEVGPLFGATQGTAIYPALEVTVNTIIDDL